jgi:hypothetical protein
MYNIYINLQSFYRKIKKLYLVAVNHFFIVFMPVDLFGVVLFIYFIGVVESTIAFFVGVRLEIGPFVGVIEAFASFFALFALYNVLIPIFLFYKILFPL